MQALTRTLKEAIRSSYQVPITKIEIINQDGSSAGEILDVIDVSHGNFISRNIRRSIKISLDNTDGQYTPDPTLYDRNLLWYNKKMKLFFGYKTKAKKLETLGTFTFDTNISSYVRGQTYTVAINQSNRAAFDSAGVKVGDYITYYGVQENKFLVITGISGYNLTVFCESNQTDGTPATWSGELIVRESDSEEWLPQGVYNINGIDPSVNPDGVTLELEGQDIKEALVEDQFDDVHKIETTATESVNYALVANGGSATASSSISAGDEIQDQATPHYVETFATVNGLEKEVVNKSETNVKNMIKVASNVLINSDFEVNSSGSGLCDDWILWNSYTYGSFEWVTGLSGKGQKINYGGAGSFGVRSNGEPLKNIKPGEKVYISFVYKGDLPGYTYFMRSVGGNVQMGTAGFTLKDIGGGWKRVFTEYVSNSSCDFGLLIGFTGAVSLSAIIDQVYLSNKPFDYWEFSFSPGQGETVTEIESEIFLDLRALLQLQQIKVNFIDGGELTDFLFTSPDNATWTSYGSATVTPSGPVRFIKFKARKRAANGDGSWSFGISEIQIKTSSNFLPAAAIDGDMYDTDWRPRPSDPDPWLRLDLGSSRTFNAIYTYWGKDSFDFWNRVKYYIETSANGSTWTRITDLNGYDEKKSFYGEVEHCISPVSARYIRINIKGRDGVAMLRHLKVANITASKTIRDNMIDILETTSIKEYRIPYTRRYVSRKMAEIGDEKEAFLQSLAVSANWQAETDENGVYIAQYRNINPVDYAWEFNTTDDNIFQFNVFLSNDIKNVIVVTYESSDKKAIVGRAIDDNPLSPTSTKNLGRRVQVYKGESYNTQEICDRKAHEQLFERTRTKHHTSIPTTGHPAIQIDDVVKVTVDEAKVIGAYFLVTGYESVFKADTAEFDTRINISLLL